MIHIASTNPFSAQTPRNCLGCTRYLECKDPLRSVIYRCSRFKESIESKTTGLARVFDFLQLDGASELAYEDMSMEDSAISPSGPRIADPSHDSGFNISKTISDIVEHDKVVSSDIKINDRDFLQAPNFYDFCVKDHYLKQKPFIEQAILGIRTLAEYCPRCTDMEWFDHTHKVDDTLFTFEQKTALLDKGVCPHCKAKRSDLVASGELKYYYEAAICCGQRSGKSAFVGMIAAYLTHLQIKLQKPNEVYGLLNANILHGTFVALTYAQAKDTLWEPYYGHLTDSPWFSSYHKMLLDAGQRYGEELLRLKDTFVMYRHRRILLYAAGPDKRTLRGRTRFFSCLTGDSLISSSAGLLPISNSALVGESTHRGTASRRITNHKLTGVRDVWRVRLSNGLALKATANHQFLCLSENSTSFVWKRQDELNVGDAVVASLGGEFPDTLHLHSGTDPQVSKIRGLGDNILATSGTFSLEEIAQLSGTSKHYVTTWLRKLTRLAPGAITRRREGSRGPFLYTVVDPEALCAESLVEGKISELRNKIVLPQIMTTDLAYIIGYLIADGNYVQNGPEITFTSTSKKKVKHFVACFKRCFGVAPRISSWELPSEKIAYNAVFALKALRDFIVYLGLSPAWSYVKRIPWSILQAPRECVAACLSAMISCDGDMKGQRLSYHSKSKNLIAEVQLLFMRLGYACTSVRGRISKVCLTAYDRDRFLETDFTGLRKRAFHKKSVAGSCVHSSAHLNYTIPGAKAVNARRPWEDCNVFADPAMNSRCLDTSEYSKVIGKGLVYAKVTSMKYLGKRKVYDISVDADDHTFTANGIAVHNSIDELGYFDNDANTAKVKMNANEVYIALERSLLTVRASAEKLITRGFDAVPTAYFINVSSPSSVRDKIMELVRKAQNSDKLYGLIKPTWEMNPGVPRSALAEEFRKDPLAAMRDYGAQPPLTANPFIESKSDVEACIGEKKNPIRITHKQVKAKDGTIKRFAVIDKIQSSRKPSCLALDAGFSNNSFAACCAHKSGKQIYIDLLVEIQPLPGIPLHYSKIYEEILGQIIDERNVKLLTADRWNSLKILSDAETEFDIATRQYSLKYADMQQFKSYLQDKQIMYPMPVASLDEILKYDQSKYPNCFKGQPVDHLLLQMLTVQDTGSQVQKGDQLTDDLLRALMLAVSQLVDPKNAELFDVADAPLKQRISMEGSAIYRGNSGGGSSSGASGALSSSMGVLKRRGG